MPSNSQANLTRQHHKAFDRFDAIGRLLMQFGPLVAGALVAAVGIGYAVYQIVNGNKKPVYAGFVIW